MLTLCLKPLTSWSGLMIQRLATQTEGDLEYAEAVWCNHWGRHPDFAYPQSQDSKLLLLIQILLATGRRWFEYAEAAG